MRRVADRTESPASIRNRSGRPALNPYAIEEATFTLTEIRRARTLPG